jgi:hypothetical protein
LQRLTVNSRINKNKNKNKNKFINLQVFGFSMEHFVFNKEELD